MENLNLVFRKDMPMLCRSLLVSLLVVGFHQALPTATYAQAGRLLGAGAIQGYQQYSRYESDATRSANWGSPVARSGRSGSRVSVGNLDCFAKKQAKGFSTPPHPGPVLQQDSTSPVNLDGAQSAAQNLVSQQEEAQKAWERGLDNPPRKDTGLLDKYIK